MEAIDGRELCKYCFSLLSAELTGSARPALALPDIECPLFVTWEKEEVRGSGDYQLRGCIGTFSAQPLGRGLPEYTLTSALRDSRFRPIAKEEIPQLSCGVSLLVDFSDGKGYLDWEIGEHGIWIEFQKDRQKRTATYLPEVAKEQGWTKEEAVRSLLRKGRFEGKITPAVLASIKLTRYRSKKARVTHSEWAAGLPAP